MEGNEQDRLEIAFQASMQNAKTNIDLLINSVKSLSASIEMATDKLNAFGKSSAFSETKKQVDNITNNSKGLTQNFSKASKAISSMFNIGKLYAFWNLTKRLRNTFKEILDNSLDFIETTNKFEVSMGNMTDKAYQFQERLSNAFGTARIDMMEFQATFNNIMSSLPGLTEEVSEQISETLVKLGLDYASLFNVETDVAMEKIQAALVGSVKPIRSDSGYDITETTIASKAEAIGVTTSVRNLNQMEKRLLRIIVLMDQMRETGALQDFARTIEQPANQIKVLTNQLKELKMWLGNVFIGTIGQILPYINGFIMALVQIVKLLAIFKGFTNTGSGLAQGLEVAETSVDGIGSGLGSAVSSAKELKRTLMGFDVLNVIQTPTSSSGGGGVGGTTGSIDPAILGALKDYDNLMDSVQMKATKIRDDIMEWLGFMKIINPLTGETSWILKEGSTRLKFILDTLKIIQYVILALVAVKLVGKLTNLFSVLKTGQTTGLTPFYSGLLGLKTAFAGIKGWIAGGIANFKALTAAEYKTGAALSQTASGMLYAIPTALKLTAGIAGLALGFYNAYDSMRDFTEGTKSAGAAFTQLGLSIGGAAAAGALIGSIFGPIGTGVGAAVGALGAGVAAWIGYKDSIELTTEATEKHNEKVDTYLQSLQKEREALEETLNSQLAEVEYTKNLTNELSTLVDANGNVKKGYEDRVNFILSEVNKAYGTEYKLIDGRITQNGEYVDSLEEVTKNIYKQIEAKKAELILQANEAWYTEALSRRTEIYKELNETEKQRKQQEQAMIDLLKKHNLTYDDWINQTAAYGNAISKMSIFEQKKLSDTATALADVSNHVVDLKIAYRDNAKDIMAIEDLKTAVIEEDEEKTAAAMQNLLAETAGITDDFSLQIEEQIAYANVWAENQKKTFVGTQEELKQKTQEYLDSQLQSIAQNLKSQTTTIENLTPEVVQGWKKLYSTSPEVFHEYFDDLPEEMKIQIARTMQGVKEEVNNAIPDIKNVADELSKAITKNADGTFSINFKADVDFKELKTKLINTKSLLERMSENSFLKNMFAKYSSNIQSVINQLTVAGYATGGFPSIGELFYAREAGPELVGTIGGRNAVVNNDQIVQAVSTGVANAVSKVLGSGGQSFQLIIDGEQITDVVSRRIARKANITGMAMGV